ncbi:MAG: hypothetical protein ACKO6M_00280, partial [Bacteroidota bacterium]
SFSAGDWVFDQVAFAVQNDTQQLEVKALCVGDVNGSNSPNINLRSSQLLMKSDRSFISGSMKGLILYPISSVTSVYVGSVSYEAQLPAGVQVVGVDWPQGSTTSNGIYHQEGQILRVSWFDPLGVKVNEGESVLTLRLQVQDLEFVGLEMIEPVVRFVEWSNVEGALYDVLNLRIPGTRNPKETPPRVYPQPATDRVVIEIPGLEFGGRLMLRNGLGQVVPILFSNTVTASSQIFEADVSGLVGGIYTWEVVSTGSRIVAQKSGRLIIR